jgi:catechol 2,3-dioxygenase-like lactoylglutathione lyase family enzyme
MAIKILEIHHHAIRMDGASDRDVLDFYSKVLGIGADEGRPTIPGVPGYWINVGAVGQLHLIGGTFPSPVARGPGQDPAAPHVALGVASVVETKAELDRLGVPYWTSKAVGPEFEQVFVNDPCGNMIELHQAGNCRCTLANRQR